MMKKNVTFPDGAAEIQDHLTFDPGLKIKLGHNKK